MHKVRIIACVHCGYPQLKRETQSGAPIGDPDVSAAAALQWTRRWGAWAGSV